MTFTLNIDPFDDDLAVTNKTKSIKSRERGELKSKR